MNKLIILVLFFAATLNGLAQEPGKDKTQAQLVEAVVQTQLDAYNKGDIDAFVATYADDIKLYRHPDVLTGSGIDQLRKSYGPFFAKNKNLKAEISHRIIQGNFVIDHERVSGLSDGSEIRAVAIYEVKDGKIQNVWFIR